MSQDTRLQPPIADRTLVGFVERTGLDWERDVLSRIAGRIVGLLLVSPGACSLDDLAETLRVSKASVSTDARRLEELAFLERTGVPGDRHDYYRVSRDLGVRSLERRDTPPSPGSRWLESRGGRSSARKDVSGLATRAARG